MAIVEFKYPVLVLPFNNCELHCCSMDGYMDNREALLSRLKQIDSYFESKPKHSRYRIWYNVDESTLNNDVLEQITKSLFTINDNIIKLAVIGAGKNKKRFDKFLRKSGFNKPTGYFSDAEMAKEWLV